MAFLKKGKTLCHLAALNKQCLQSKFSKLHKAQRKKTSSGSGRGCWLTALGGSWKEWHDKEDVESSVYDDEDDEFYLDQNKGKVFFEVCEGEDDAHEEEEEESSWFDEDDVDDSVYDNNEDGDECLSKEFKEEQPFAAQVKEQSEKLSKEQNETPLLLDEELGCEQQQKKEIFDQLSFAYVINFFDNFKKAQQRCRVAKRRLHDDEAHVVAENDDSLEQQSRLPYDWHDKQMDDDGTKPTKVELLDYRKDAAIPYKPKLIKHHQKLRRDFENSVPDSNRNEHNTKIPLNNDADSTDPAYLTNPTRNDHNTSKKFLMISSDWAKPSSASLYAYLMRLYPIARVAVPRQEHATLDVDIAYPYRVESTLIKFITALYNSSSRTRQRDLHLMGSDADHHLADAATHEKANSLVAEAQSSDRKPPRSKVTIMELEQEKAVANDRARLCQAEPVWRVEDNDEIQLNDKHRLTATAPIVNDDQEEVLTSTSELLVNSVKGLTTRRDENPDGEVQISLPVAGSDKKDCLDPELNLSSSVDLKKDLSDEEPPSSVRQSNKFESSNDYHCQIAESCTESSDAGESFVDRQVKHDSEDDSADSVNVNLKSIPLESPSTTPYKTKKHVTIIEEPTEVWEIPSSLTTSDSNESLRVFCDSDHAENCELKSSEDSKSVTRTAYDSADSQVNWSKVENSSYALMNKRSSVDVSKKGYDNVKLFISSNILDKCHRTPANDLQTLPNKESSDDNLIDISNSRNEIDFASKMSKFEKLLAESSNEKLLSVTQKPSSIKVLYDSSKSDLQDLKQSRSNKDPTVSSKESHMDTFNIPKSQKVYTDFVRNNVTKTLEEWNPRSVLSDSKSINKESPKTCNKLKSRMDRLKSAEKVTVKKLKNSLSKRDLSKSVKENFSENLHESKSKKRFTDSSEEKHKVTSKEAKPSNAFSDSSKKHLEKTFDKPKSRKLITNYAKENNTEIYRKQKRDKYQSCDLKNDKREKSSCKKHLTESSSKSCAEKLKKSKSRNGLNYSKKNSLIEEYEKSKSRKGLSVISRKNSMNCSPNSKLLSTTPDCFNKTCKASELSQSNSLKSLNKDLTKNIIESKSRTNFLKYSREKKEETFENQKTEAVVPESSKESFTKNPKRLRRPKDLSEFSKEIYSSVSKASKTRNNFSDSLKENCEDFAEKTKPLKVLPNCSKERHAGNSEEYESNKKPPEDFLESYKTLKTKEKISKSLNEKNSQTIPRKPLPESLRQEITEFLRKTKEILPSEKKVSSKKHSKSNEKNIQNGELTDKSVATWSRKPVDNELLMMVNDDHNPSTSKEHALMVGAPGANSIASLTTRGLKEFQKFQRMDTLLRKLFGEMSSDSGESSTCVDGGFRIADESDQHRQSSPDRTVLDRAIDSESASITDVISFVQISPHDNLNNDEERQAHHPLTDDLAVFGDDDGNDGGCLMLNHYREHDEIISGGQYIDNSTGRDNGEASNLYRCCLVVSFMIVFLLLYLLWMAPPLLHKPIEPWIPPLR